jgi:hypothetical protein
VRRDDAASPPLSATLCFNVASVLWKLSAMSAEEVEVAVEKADTGYECVHSPTLGQLTAMMTSRASILLGCVDFCERCLSICGGDHKKALYRLSAALLELDRAAEAIDKLDEYFKQQRLLTSGSVGGEDVAALHDMRRKCIARVVLKGGSRGEVVLRHQEAHTAALPQIVGNATSKVLSQLQARRGRIHNSVSHPWDGIIRDEDESAAAEGKRPLTDAGRGINSHACPPLLLYSSLHFIDKNLFNYCCTAENALAELHVGDFSTSAEGDEAVHRLTKTTATGEKKKDGSSKKKLAAAAQEEKRKKCVKVGIKFRKQSTSLDRKWTVTTPCAECAAHQQATTKVRQTISCNPTFPLPPLICLMLFCLDVINFI